jgi:BlaI family penicillinase repressor
MYLPYYKEAFLLDRKISLSDGEWKLMNCLWERAPRTITELVNSLKGETDWNKHTVIPTLNRLEAKGAVRYERGARAKLYSPSVDRNNVAIAETHNFLAKVHRGRIGLMLSSMIEEDALSKEDIDELNEILNNAESKMKSSGSSR